MSKGDEIYTEMMDIIPFDVPEEIRPYIRELAESSFIEGKKSGSRSLSKLVKKMREAQKAYFRNSGNPIGKKKLAESKKLEAQVDRAVEAVLG